MITQIDIDYIFGKKILGSEKCGGRGYPKSPYTSS